MESTNAAYELNANSNDRLGFGLFIAAALHVCLLFGVFVSPESIQSSIADLEITLVTHFSDATPEDADFWAQKNQQASGTEEEVLALTTTDRSAASGQNDATGTEKLQADFSAQTPGIEVLSTSGQSDSSAKIDIDADEELSSNAAEEIARRQTMLARLDSLQQEYAKRPRVGTLTSVSAKARDDAEYQLHLQERIIETGNTNYPEASLQQGVYGGLRLMMTILPDGTLESLEILESSGKLMLDRAALDIAQLASPFQNFPAGTADRYDKIVFIRTWQFLPGGELHTSE